MRWGRQRGRASRWSCSAGGSSAPCGTSSRPGPGMGEARWEPRGCGAGTLPQSPQHLEGNESLAEPAQPDPGVGTSQKQQVRLEHGQLHWHTPVPPPPQVTPLPLFHATRPPMAQLQQRLLPTAHFQGMRGQEEMLPSAEPEPLGLSCPVPAVVPSCPTNCSPLCLTGTSQPQGARLAQAATMPHRQKLPHGLNPQSREIQNLVCSPL